MRAIIELKREKTMPEFTLRIENMHCGACIRRVSQALAATDGLEVKEVRVGAARVSSSNDPAPVEQAVAALEKAGYPARLED
jgi:copper chaperone CopZ